MIKNETRPGRLPMILLVLSITAFIFSAIRPLDRLAWMGQVVAAILLILLLTVTYRKFRFTNFVYVMVFLHVLVLLYGAHYTYSQNPLFNYLQDQFGWGRNYFDRLGHFAQGFVPAFLLKEFLWRAGYVKKGKVLGFLVILSCLGFSAVYELSEFALIKMLAVPVDEVMGTQGDIFDSYWDMFWALIGSIFAVTLFGPYHNHQMDNLS